MLASLYIQWTPSSDLGIPILDEQHRGIVSTINTLHYFSSQGKGLEALLPTFKIMEQYSILHFELEETLMRNANFPDYEKHCLAHRELIEKTIKVRNQSTLYKDTRVALAFLKEWWIDHIKGEDREYIDWVKKSMLRKNGC